MGREARVRADVGSETGEVKALLESQELILRGEIRRRFSKASMTGVTVDGDTLRFISAGETVRLHLGSKVAQAWAKAIATMPPSLRAKLGLEKGARALLIGACDDAELVGAIKGALTDNIAEAAMLIVRVDGADDLKAAWAVATQLPISTIYPKGKNVVFGDAAVRAAMRRTGFRDTKACAVSDNLTATRYDPGVRSAASDWGES
jgi:hypothetical protein